MTITRQFKGFTLIETMIVAAIIAILVAIAYPSYKESTDRGRRSDAKAVLLENAQWMERHYTLTNKYDKLADDSALTKANLPTQEAPRDGTAKSYTIEFAASSPTTNTFTLVAIPKNSMNGDKCGTLTLTNTGVKGPTTAGCWDK